MSDGIGAGSTRIDRAARVVVELSAASALDLVDAVHAAQAAIPPELSGVPAGRLPAT